MALQLAMTQSPLPYFLVLSTAYSYILYHTWQCHLLSVFVSSWTFAFAAHLLIWLGWIYPYHVSELRHIPTVPGFPLWGQFFEIINQECGVPQRNWHQQYGPIVRYFLPFGSERLSIVEQSVVSRITGDRSMQYPKPLRTRLWKSFIFGNGGLLLAEGYEHSHQRRMLLPAFSAQSIKDSVPIFWEKAFVLVRLWDEQVKDEKSDTATLEVLDWLSRAILDATGKACFGYEIDSLDQPESAIRASYRLLFSPTSLSQLFQGLQAFFPPFRHVPIKLNRDVDHARGVVANLASRILHQKRFRIGQNDSSYKRGRDIISMMTNLDPSLNAAGEEGVPFLEKRDQVMTFLGAGHDTTAVALAWSLHLLAEHREVQGRLRQELKTYFPFLFGGQVPPSSATLAVTDPDRLPYLNNVCREVLRYIPPIPMISRESLVDDVLAGYHVPAGTTIHVVANAINHLPMYWGGTASDFDPDRWDNLPDCWTPSAFMTFSRGLRACIGRRFLETEMKVLLCALLSRFEFNRNITNKNPEKSKVWAMALRPKNGITLRVSVVPERKDATYSEVLSDKVRIIRRATV